MKRVEVLDFNSFAFMQEGENVNMIYTHPLPFFSAGVSNGSLVVKHQLKKVPYAPNTTNLDSLDNVTVKKEEDTPTVPITPPTEGREATDTPEALAEEVPETMFSYIVNQDNRLVFLVSKDEVMNDCMAKEFIVGLIVSYQTPRVFFTTPSGATATYNMIVKRGADDRVVTAYQQSSLGSLLQLLPGLDATLDVNITGGYKYEIFRDLTACKKS